MSQPDAQALAVHADFLRRLAGALLDSPDLAEDAVQTTVALAWRKGGSAARLPAWMAGTLRNVARNLRRAEGRRERRLRTMPVRRPSSPEEIREREATRRRLIDAVLALPDALRDAVLLRYDDGLPPREVAARLGVSVDAAEGRIRRGLASLRERLGDEEGGDASRVRMALAGVVGHLPRAGFAGALGGLVMGKVVAASLAAALLVAGAWWFVRTREAADDGTGRADSASSASAEAEHAEGPTLRSGAPGAASAEADAAVAALFGRVLDARTRTPVPGARVRAFGYEDLRRRDATADDDGRFRLPDTEARDGAFHLVVDAPGYARHVDLSARGATAARTVLLERGGVLRGALVEAADGAPVPRYQVVAVRRSSDVGTSEQYAAMAAVPEELALEARRDVTDPDGRFSLEALSAGTYVLVFLVEGRAPWFWSGGAREYDKGSGFAVTEAGTTEAGTVRLPRSGAITVRVRDASTHAPLSGATFEAAAVVDRRGVRSPLLPSSVDGGDYVLPLHVSERNEVTEAHLFVRRAGYAVTTASFVGQGPKEPVEIDMARPAAVRGTLRDASGAALPAVLVVVREESYGDVRGTASAAADGSYAIDDLPSGAALTLLVFDRSASQLEAMVPFHLAPGETRTLDVGGRQATGLVGRIAADGRGIAGALVFLDLPDQRLSTSTDAEGRFRIEVPPGRFPLFVNAQATFGVFLEREVVVAEGRVTDVSVDLSRSIRGSVVVTNPDAVPAEAGLSVAARDTSQPDGWQVETQVPPKDGSFDLRVPGPGTYSVSVTGGDFFLADGPVVVDLTRDATPGDVRLVATADPADGEVEIEVTDAETGGAVPRAWFELRGVNQSGSGSGSDDGVIRLVGHQLRLGAYEFVVGSPVHVPERVGVRISLDGRVAKASVALHRSDAVRIADLAAGSRAGAEGLRVGDLILRYGETPVPTEDALREAIAATSPTDRVRLHVLRDGLERTLVVPGGCLGAVIVNARRAASGR